GGGDGGGVGDDGGDGLRLWLPDGEGRRRVEESEVSGWLDRLTRSILEVAGKISPENFSGGGAVVAAVAGGGGRPPVDRCWFKTYKLVEDGSVLYMGDDHFVPIHGKGSVVLEFRSGKSITLFNVLYVPNLRVFIGFGYYNNGMFMLNLNKVPDDSGSVYMSSSTVVNSSLWHARLGHVHYKRMLEMYKDDFILAIDENPKNVLLTIKKVELQQNDLIKTLRMDRDGEYYGHVFFQSLGIIHETTAPYIPQQNGVDERKNKGLEEMVNSMAVVRLPDPKGKTLGKKESRDAIFNENCFSSIPRPKDIIPNSDESLRDDHSNDVSSETPKPRRGKRARKAKSYGSDFQLYLVEGSRDQIGSQYSYCYSIEEDPVGFLQLLTIKDHEYAAEKINTYRIT
ncbi:zinc finger, CCHC-type containing protein, partial [Tanacetum coccineum]